MVPATSAAITNFPGRVEDRTELRAKSGLLEIARYMLKTKSGHYRLTGNQHVILAGITSEHLTHIKEILAKYKLDNQNFSGLRLSS
jgi:sulfite reductase (NADPH) hemoprotein beta-component